MASRAIEFVKMHGAGNDFFVFDARKYADLDYPELARKVCSRRFSVGADGIIGLTDVESADIGMFYFNADGSRSVCGNGLRCLAGYALERENSLSAKSELTVMTDDGISIVKPGQSKNELTVDMGKARHDASEVPTKGQGPQLKIKLEVKNQELEINAASMGNPHCVIFVDKLGGELSDELVHGLGSVIEEHDYFPERTNVEFVKLTGSNQAQMRVWERGVGETMACGTGNCAIFAVCMENSLIDGPELSLTSPGGEFKVSYGPEKQIMLTGPVKEVYEGKFVFDYE